MDTIITIADPGYPYDTLYLFLAIGGAGIPVSALGFWLLGFDRGAWLGAIGATVGVGACIVGGIGSMAQPPIDYGIRVEEAKAASLEEAGFTDVELSGDKFTASDDGAYFKGALVEVGDLTWQVVEVKR